MKKILTIAIVILIITICFSGCTTGGSYTFVKPTESSGSNFWKVSYEKFDGYKQREITISGEGEHTFTVEIETNSGTLGLSIKDKDGISLYSGNKMPSSSFGVIADGEGKYIIRFDADEHSGSFDIKWE